MASLVILALVACANARVTLNRDRPDAARVAGQVRVGGEATVLHGARVTLRPTLETFQPDVTPPCVETDRAARTGSRASRPAHI